MSRPSQWASTGWHWSGKEGRGIRRGERRAPNGVVKGVALEMCLKVVRVLVGLQSHRTRWGRGCRRGSRGTGASVCVWLTFNINPLHLM